MEQPTDKFIQLWKGGSKHIKIQQIKKYLIDYPLINKLIN